MAHGPENLTAPGPLGFGLQFLNDEWNDSISNGDPFTIRWNQSLNETLAPELGLFKITYPHDGVAVYELVSNLTNSMNTDNSTCVWTPNNLDDDLYTLFLLSSRNPHSNWTASPPWRLKEPPRYPFHWAAPIVIPIVVLLFLYTLGLTTCVIYRRQKKAKQNREEQGGEDPALRRDTERHPSVDTIVTVQTMDDSDEIKKPNIWLLTQSPSGSLFFSPKKTSSGQTLISPISPSSEQTLASPISPSELSLLTPTSTSSDRTLVASITNPREYRVARPRLERARQTLRVVPPDE